MEAHISSIMIRPLSEVCWHSLHCMRCDDSAAYSSRTWTLHQNPRSDVLLIFNVFSVVKSTSCFRIKASELHLMCYYRICSQLPFNFVKNRAITPITLIPPNSLSASDKALCCGFTVGLSFSWLRATFLSWTEHLPDCTLWPSSAPRQLPEVTWLQSTQLQGYRPLVSGDRIMCSLNNNKIIH